MEYTYTYKYRRERVCIDTCIFIKYKYINRHVLLGYNVI